MAATKITYADKSPGDQVTSGDLNQIKVAANGGIDDAAAALAVANTANTAAGAAQTTANAAIPASQKGTANGVATLGSDSKIPSAQLPSYVDDVLEFANLAAFPGTGETGKIYIAIDTNREYRWSGSVYVQIVASPGTTDAVPEGTVNLYFTVARVLSAVLTGISFATSTAITATDTVLSALGKLQAQITVNVGALGNKVGNDTDTYTSTPKVTQIVTLSQAEYDAIPTKTDTTLYLIQ